MKTNLKKTLSQCEPTIGSWITLGHPAIAEIMAAAGFAWLAIDLEHSAIELREAQDLIRAIEAAGVTPLVRLTSNHPDQAKRVLDAGARGIIAPMVNSSAGARAAVDATRYPPTGKRGVGLSRAQGYGTAFADYLSTIEPELVVIVQIEHAEAVEALREILLVPGVDGTIIGPYDLSASVGRPGQFGDPVVADLLGRYETICTDLGKPMGYHVVQPDPALVTEKQTAGYTFLGFGVDFLFLGENCRQSLGQLRGSLGTDARSAVDASPTTHRRG